MDRPRIKCASVLGMGAVLAMAGCHGMRNHREIPPSPPLSRESEPAAQFHSEPNPVQQGMNGPTVQGGAVARGGSAFGPGGAAVTPPAGAFGDLPPATQEGTPAPAAGAGAGAGGMGMPPGYP